MKKIKEEIERRIQLCIEDRNALSIFNREFEEMRAMQI